LAVPLPPEFFVVIGVLVFIDGGIATLLLDRHFPAVFPYVLLLGAFFGFALLTLAPSSLTSLSRTLQFYYSLAYSLAATLCVVGSDLFLFLAKRRALASGVFALVAAVPAVLVNAFFVNAYVNNVPVEVPQLPKLPIGIVYAILVLTAVLLVALLILVAYYSRKQVPASPPAAQ